MNIQRVSLQGVKCFRNPVELAELSPAINLIVGPNESGKSTLMLAIARCLFDRARSSAQDLQQLQPWGTNLAPWIQVEFEAQGQHYQLTKQFLNNPFTKLARLEKGQFVLWLEGEGAENFVRELYVATAAPSGATKPSQWGIAQFLWALQDPKGAVGVNDIIADHLRQSLGGIALSPLQGMLAQRLQNLYDINWTPTGKLKANSTLNQLLAQKNELQKQVEELEEQYQQAVQMEEELESIEGEWQRLSEELAAKQEEEGEWAEKAEQVRQLREQIEQLQSLRQQAEERYRGLEDKIKHYESLKQSIKELQQQLESLEEAFRSAEIQCEASVQLREQARQEYEAAQQALQQATAALERAREWRQARQWLDEEAELKRRQEELAELKEQLTEAQQAFGSRSWPSEQDVQEAWEKQQKAEILQAQLEAVGVQVEVELLSPQQLTLAGGAERLELAGQGGEKFTYKAGEEALIILPDIARIRARSGAAEPKELAAQLEEAVRARDKKKDDFGASSLQELHELQQQGQQLKMHIQQLQEEIKAVLRPYSDEQALLQQLNSLIMRLNAFLERYQLTREALAEETLSEEQIMALEQAVQQAEHDLQQKLEIWQQRQREWEDAIQRKNDMEMQLTETRVKQEGEQRRQEDILRQEGCPNWDSLRQRGQEAKQRYDELQAQIQALEAQLPEEAADPERFLATVRQALEEIQQEQRRREDRALELRTKLEQLQTNQTYERLNWLEEQLQHIAGEIQRHAIQALGVKLLHALYQYRRGEVPAALSPLKDKFERLLRNICGVQRPAEFASDFSLQRIKPNADLAPQNLSQFSTGTQEQIELCLRLALGELYAENSERQVLVLDDVLVYTDRERHQRILEILKIAAEKLQIFILTSDVTPYRGLPARIYQVSAQHEVTAVG